MKLSRSPKEFFENSGWSAKLFIDHAKKIYDYFGDELQVGRTVVHLRNLRIYVHFNGRSREYMTVCDKFRNELYTFHYLESPETVLTKLNHLLNDSQEL